MEHDAEFLSLSPQIDKKSSLKKQQFIKIDSIIQTDDSFWSEQDEVQHIQQYDATSLPTLILPAVNSDFAFTEYDADVIMSGIQYGLIQERQTQPLTTLHGVVPETPWLKDGRISSPTLDQSTISLPITPLPTLPTLPVTPALPPQQTEVPARVQLLSIMNKGQRFQYLCCVIGWLAVNVYFWSWWLQPSHVGNTLLYSLMTAAFFYEQTLLPTLYTFFLGQMRMPAMPQEQGIPASVKRVAAISLTVPGSESLDIVKRQMVTMKNIR